MRPGGEWSRYPRCPGATPIGTAAVHLIGGSRAEAKARRTSARDDQDERWRRTGYVGGDIEAATAVRLLVRELGGSAGAQEYSAQLVAIGKRYNFQGQWRLALLAGVSRRSAQRYRAWLEEMGLIESQLLRAGDMLDDQRAPVTRTHVVRDVWRLVEEARPLRARRGPQRRRGEPRQKQKRQRRRSPAVLVPRPRDASPVEPAEIVRFTASIAPAAGVVGGGSEHHWVSIAPEPAELHQDELDELDRELAALESLESYRARGRPPD